MINKKECEIIRDLLPIYIDKLTNNTTNEFIEEHIKICDECKKICDNMKIEIYNKEKNEKNIDFFKKHKKKLNILKLLVAVLLVTLIIVSIYASKLFRNNFEESQKMLYKTIEDLEEAGYQLVTIVEDDGTIRKDIISINEIDN